jgi:hypothetical protein
VKFFTVLLVLFSIGTLFTAHPSFMPSQQPSTTTTTATTTLSATCDGYQTTTLTTTACYLGVGQTEYAFRSGITIRTDKSTYLQGETVNVTGEWRWQKPPYECQVWDVIVPDVPLLYVIMDSRRTVLSSGSLYASSKAPYYHDGNFTFSFMARYDWPPGNYTVEVFSDLRLQGQASTSVQVVANPSAVVTTVTTWTTYTTTVPEFTSLALILGMATILIALFVRRIDRTRMSRGLSLIQTSKLKSCWGYWKTRRSSF